MAILEGRWAWWNQNHATSFDLPRMVQRARDARLKGVIIKYGHPDVEAAFTRANIPFLVERYVYPSQPEAEAQKLANAVDAGAVAAVINAEVEWESQSAAPMERLIAAFRARHPMVELYASVDTRGNRLSLPYQQVLRRHIAGWLPMVYPKTFGQSVAKAFSACLDGKEFGGVPVLPTIQTYDGIGATTIAEQLAEVKRRGLPGCQAYTIAHATDAEWAEFAREEDTMSEADKAELYVLRVLAGVQEALAQKRTQDAANAMKVYLGVTAK